jgi:hypothetical protein
VKVPWIRPETENGKKAATITEVKDSEMDGP